MSGPSTESARKSDKSKLAGDAGALLIVQGLGYLIPLATLPYLVRTLGQAGFGTYGLAIAFAGYVQIVLDYGFWLSGTRRAIPLLEDRAGLSQLYWAVHGAKLILLMLVAGPVGIAVFFVPSLKGSGGMIALLILAAVGSTLFPVWLLQARGKLNNLAHIALGIKLSNFAVFWVVQGPEDIYRLGLFLVLQSWCHGLVGQFVALRGISLHPPTSGWLRESVRQIGRDFTIFVSQLGGLLVANTTTVVLGSISGPAVLGGYLVADRIARAASSLTGPVSQAALPISARMFHEGPASRAFAFLRKFFWSAGGVISVGCGLMYWAGPQIVHLVSGGRDQQTVECLRIMSLFPFLVFLNNLLASQILLNLHRDKAILLCNLAGGTLALLLQPVVLPRYGAIGAAGIVVFAEGTMVACLLLVVTRTYLGLQRSEKL